MTTPPHPPHDHDTNSPDPHGQDDADPAGATPPNTPSSVGDPGGIPPAAMDGFVYAKGHGRRDKCGAKRKQDGGKPCAKPAGHSTPHVGFGFCNNHGGCTPDHVAGAAKVMAADSLARDVSRRVVKVDASPVTDPVGELARLAGTVRATVDVLSERVNALGELTNTTDAGSEQVRAVVALWERMIKQSHALLADLARLGIEDRTVRLEEARVEAVVGVCMAVAGALLERVCPELRPGDAGRLREVWPGWVGPIVAGELRALGPGEPAAGPSRS